MTGPDGKESCCTPERHESPAQGCRTGIQPVQGMPVPEATRHACCGTTDGMIKLDGGRFLMGTEDDDAWAEDGEGPIREVTVSPFWIDATTVTNAQFAQFVDSTGYVTESERFGWSYVFLGQLPKSKQRKMKASTVMNLQWWYAVEGAFWRKPEGAGTNILKRMDHPVVHVSWSDAEAYARWAGKRLPAEAEWEFAARGGLVQKKYCWGDELTPEGKHRCNIWQGVFPDKNSAADGYAWTAPSRSFRPNGYGLYNMAGNVWEWCADWFSPDWHRPASPLTRDNPRGPDGGQNKVMRGGSFLCHISYCNRYRVAARTANTPDSATTNCGFRCVRDV